MDDAAINRAVAERIGWAEASGGIMVQADGRWLPKSGLPNFATSLDAMAEAEATLSESERARQAAAMLDMPKEMVPEPPSAEVIATSRLTMFDMGVIVGLVAPARTRALAFLAATQNRVTATKEPTP